MLLPASIKMAARKRSEYKTVIEDLWSMGVLTDEMALPLLTGNLPLSTRGRGNKVPPTTPNVTGQRTNGNQYFELDKAGGIVYTDPERLTTTKVNIKPKATAPSGIDAGDRVFYEIAIHTYNGNFTPVVYDDGGGVFHGIGTGITFPAFDATFASPGTTTTVATNSLFRLTVGIIEKDHYESLAGSIVTAYYTASVV